MKFKSGDIREDGMIFWSKNPTSQNGEYWMTPTKYKEKQAAQAARRKINYPIWYAKNKEKIIKQVRDTKTQFPDKVKTWVAKTRSKRREAIRESNRLRQVGLSVRDIPLKERRLIREVYKMATRISTCTGIKHHVDHVHPLARGGKHTIHNLQVLPAVINMRKGAKI